MKINPILTVILLLLYFSAFTQEEEESLKQNALTTGNTYALIIGISDYKDSKIVDLKYAHRDADEFYSFLLSPAGGNVPPANIKLLKNQEATISNIYVAKKWLESIPKKDDIVYFYFAGHGDVENSLYELGFLLAYDTPYQNYLNNAVRIEDFNNMANTLSVTKDVNVYLITDACHSGKLAGSDNRGQSLVGGQLSKVKSREVRLASCESDQLSEESDIWGGGRGVFSWYFVNGLKGLADTNTDGIVTFQEIKTFLESKVPEAVSKHKNKMQTPVAEGKGYGKMSIVNETILAQIKANEQTNIVAQTGNSTTSRGAKEQLILSDDAYFYHQFTHKDTDQNLEGSIDFKNLAGKNTSIIIDTFLKTFTFPDQRVYSTVMNFATLVPDSIKARIGSYDELKRYKSETEIMMIKEQIAALIHNRVQEVINLYLQGDAAELEKRRYYNVVESAYDEYVAMAKVARQLLDANHPLNHILEVKQYYFEGVTDRIKIPLFKNADSLINLALQSQTTALKLAPYAAYINNELGILNLYKNNQKAAKNYFTKAGTLAPSWAIPWANLTDVHLQTDSITAARKTLKKAMDLQADLQNNTLLAGKIREKEFNWLLAEEQYRKAIEINQRYFLPFDRLGNVYTNTTRYAEADSFYYEGALRKKGFNIENNQIISLLALNFNAASNKQSCGVVASGLLDDDVMAFFYLGHELYSQKNYNSAAEIFKKVISADKKDPLVFHYLGKVYFDQQKWKEAEIMFKYAIQYFKNEEALTNHADSMLAVKKYAYDRQCIYRFYLSKIYAEKEDYYFLGSLYESWAHYDEAENYYRKAMEINREGDLGAEVKLYKMLEKLERYTEAENILTKLENKEPEIGQRELNQFYRNTAAKQPQDAYWPYKLGQLLCSLSQKPAEYNYHDTIVYFPVLGREVFLDTTNREEVYDNPEYAITEYNPDGSLKSIYRSVVKYYDGKFTIEGTKEIIQRGPRILSPRKDGIFYLEKAADLIGDPTTLANIHFKLGDIYQWAGSKRQALPQYQKSMEYKPDLPNTRMKIVDMSVYLYENTIALEQLNALKDSQWINFSHSKILAEFLTHSSQYDKAKKVILDNRNIHPYPQSSWDDLSGRNELVAHKYKDAVPYYKSLLRNDPKNHHASYSLARIYAFIKDKSSALKYLSSAIKNGFNYDYVLQNDEAWKSYKNDKTWNELSKSYTPKQYVSLQHRGQ